MTTDLNSEPLPEARELLNQDTFEKALSVLRGNAPTDQDAKTRQSQAHRPALPSAKHRGYDFGDMVMVDSTPVDIAVRTSAGTVERIVWALFAICASTRYLWIRLVLGKPRGKHLGLLLHDVMNPQPYGAPATAYTPLSTKPGHWQVNAWPPVFGDAPAGTVPGIIVADHGSEEENQHVLSLIGEHGLQIEWARSIAPTDKAEIESSIKTFALGSQVVPGHIGNAVKNSPSTTQRKNAHYGSFAALQKAFTAFPFWYAAQPHSGLPHPDYPDRLLTPSEAVNWSLAHGNPLRLAGNPNLPLFYLHRTLQTPTESGVSFGSQVYVPKRDEAHRLGEIIKESHGRGRSGRALKQVFFHDPGNPTRIFWNKPNTFEMLTLFAPGGDGLVARPLNDYAIQALGDFAGHPRQSSGVRAESVSEWVAHVRDVYEEDLAASDPAEAAAKAKARGTRPNDRALAADGFHYDDDDFDDLTVIDTDFG